MKKITKSKLKFKIGDRVRIRVDLVVDDPKYIPVGFIPMMKEYRGKSAIIIKMITFDNKKFKESYKLDIDNGAWNWTDEMLTDDNQVEVKR